MSLDPLLVEAKKMQEKLVEWRRDFHQHPELGFEEERTSQIVADYLDSLGLEVERIAKTGVVGLLRCKSRSNCWASCGYGCARSEERRVGKECISVMVRTA